MNIEILKNYINIPTDSSLDDKAGKLSLFMKLLKEWNEKFNLTAICDDEEIYEKHFIDSLTLNNFVSLENKKLCDIGTGAGFPGIPLAIFNPSLNVTLVESIGKKVSFLEEVKKRLNLDNVTVIKSRAEEIKSKEQFDYITARAVTELNVLLELSIPLLKVNGSLIAYKLFEVEDEIKRASHALKVLDAKVVSNNKYELPITHAKRSLLVITKNSKTKSKYPRLFAEISKSPL